jgi:phosphate transport system permease protein
MATVTPTRPDPAFTGEDLPLTHPILPRWAPAAVAVAAIAAGALVAIFVGGGLVGAVLVAVLVFGIAWPVWTHSVEGPRAAKDQLATVLMWSAFAVAMVPLVTLIYAVLANGLGVISAEFFTSSMRNQIGEGGGIYHAIMGSLMITGMAAVMSVPVGMLAAVYLVEYGNNSRLAKSITFLVDVMTGIPSIVAGLFAYALFVLLVGPGVRMGFGGSIALSILMLPIVVRSTEEMLKLVPDELREASYALGVSKWRTIVKVVVPTALAGIVTGVTLAIARVFGETAPLLIIAGATDSVNFNLFDGRMATLPVFAFYSYTQPGVPPEYGQARAWGAALVLISIVMLLNVIARMIGRRFAPKTGR